MYGISNPLRACRSILAQLCAFWKSFILSFNHRIEEKRQQICRLAAGFQLSNSPSEII